VPAGLCRTDVLGVLTAVADGVPVDLGWLEGLAATSRRLSDIDALTAILSICGDFRRRTLPVAPSFTHERDRRQWTKLPDRPRTRPRS